MAKPAGCSSSASERPPAPLEARLGDLESVEFRLRRHGRRSLRFQGALLMRTGEPGEPKLNVYETIEGAFVVAVELPGYYTDAWRCETVDDALERLASFDPHRCVGVDCLSTIDRDSGERPSRSGLVDGRASAAAKLQGMVDELLRATAASTY